METKVVLPEGTKEVIVREGTAPDIKDPMKIGITGKLDSPLRWIQGKEIDVANSHVIVDRRLPSIILMENEKEFFRTEIQGRMTVNPDLLKFGINEDKKYDPHSLANLIKMNRRFFIDQQTAMKLVTDLKGFKAKVNKKIEDIEHNNGSRKAMLDQVVDSNIPETFSLIMEIYIGYPKKTFSVELIVESESLQISLISPDLIEAMETLVNNEVEKQVSEIANAATNIVIIEK